MDAWILGTGSKGNATLVRCGNTTLLLDAGVPLHELENRAKLAGVSLQGVHGIVLTHAHGDHAAFAETYSTAWDAPVYLTNATRRGLRFRGRPKLRVFGRDSAFGRR